MNIHRKTSIKLFVINAALIGLLLPLLLACGENESPQPWSEKMALSEMSRFPELWMVENASTPKWSYTFGLVAKAMIELSEVSDDERYFDYVRQYADTLIADNGSIGAYRMESYNIDHISPGKILFNLYEKTGDTKLKKAIDTLYAQLQSHPRTSEGGFWHKQKYPHQMWLDGIYMASPFLAQYASFYQQPELYNDVVNQITTIAKHTYDPQTSLFYHGWDESKQQYWADRESGTSPGFWSRSMGWYGAALVDVLEFLPADHTGRDTVIQIIQTLAAGIQKYQDPESAVWYQVTNQGNREGNYLESSGSSLFVYFLAKAVNERYIDPHYRDVAENGFDGIIRNFIREEENGTHSITHCCAVAGLGGDGKPRDGSFEYYISEPVIDNDPKATGSFILAALEIEQMRQNNHNE